jgi:hypothetical protein
MIRIFYNLSVQIRVIRVISVPLKLKKRNDSHPDRRFLKNKLTTFPNNNLLTPKFTFLTFRAKESLICD